MQIIIEIPESQIPKQQNIIEIPLHFIDGKVCEAGGYGFAELPKGHGRLIDADKLWDSYHDLDYDFYEAFDLADTIIEADTESEGKE